MKYKSSQTILYFIFATIGVLIFVYYLLSDKHSVSTNVSPQSVVTPAVNKILSEVNFDQLTNVVTDAKFSDIVIT